MSFCSGKNVLVTGAAGISGHSLVQRLLSEGATVRATTFKTRNLQIQNHNLEVVSCDLMNIEDCNRVVKDIDVVFNCVAFIRGAHGQLQLKTDLVRNNLIPTINMIDASCKAGVQVFGYIGSSTVYPDVSYEVKEEEGFSGDPCEVYEGIAWVKRYCEKACLYFNRVTNTKFVVCRTTALYGPFDNFNAGQGHVIPELIVKAENRENPFEVWGDGTQVRDFIFVDDFVDGFLSMVDKKHYADPINIASGKSTTIKELVSCILKTSGYSPEVFFNTKKPTMISVRRVSVEKAKQILNWSSSVSLEDGIKQTIDWYRNSPRI